MLNNTYTVPVDSLSLPFYCDFRSLTTQYYDELLNDLASPDIPWLIKAKQAVKVVICPTTKGQVVVTAEPYPRFRGEGQTGSYLKFIVGGQTGIAAKFQKGVQGPAVTLLSLSVT